MRRLMNRVIGFDLQPSTGRRDIVIATGALEEHLRLLRIVVERLKKAKLTMKMEKSEFFPELSKLLSEVSPGISSGNCHSSRHSLSKISGLNSEKNPGNQ